MTRHRGGSCPRRSLHGGVGRTWVMVICPFGDRRVYVYHGLKEYNRLALRVPSVLMVGLDQQHRAHGIIIMAQCAFITSFPDIDAIKFADAYLFDAVHRDTLARTAKNGTPTMKIDVGRVNLSPDIIALYPRVAEMMMTVGVVKRMRLLDFAYHVMQGNAPEEGMTVVPINQQMTDLRAANLVLMRGESGKNFKRTDLSPPPEFGLTLDGYLPRGVSICADGKAGKFFFNVVAVKPSARISFARGEERVVFAGKVAPLLVGTGDDAAVYQALCASFFSTGLVETTTTTTTRTPRAKRIGGQDQIEVPVACDGMRECDGVCNTRKKFEEFDGNRKTCKDCQKHKRAAAAGVAAAGYDETNTWAPEACTKCEKPFEAAAFIRRGPSYRGVCRECVKRMKTARLC